MKILCRGILLRRDRRRRRGGRAGQFLTDCIASQVALHRLYGGVVPEIASRKHIEAIYALADEALAPARP